MKRLICPPSPPYLFASASVVGQKENEGPLRGLFDYHDDSNLFGCKTYESAESEMQHLALNLALHKAGMGSDMPDALLAGDLLNQCTASAYGLLSFSLPYFGLYGACSSSAEGLLLGAMLLGGGIYEQLGIVVSSHFASAERQFRYPLEYGAQRTPTSQWTVTGSGAFLLSRTPRSSFAHGVTIRLTRLLPGKIVTAGVKDLNNMGAAMAPAAFDTLRSFFLLSGELPACYDGIFTGDLGAEGSAILRELMRDAGYDIAPNHDDCGLLIYDGRRQDTHAGGSGCGCSAAVLSAKLLPDMAAGKTRRILFLATGALMSPASVAQGSSIPAIAHLAEIEVGEPISEGGGRCRI